MKCYSCILASYIGHTTLELDSWMHPRTSKSANKAGHCAIVTVNACFPGFIAPYRGPVLSTGVHASQNTLCNKPANYLVIMVASYCG